MGPSVGQARAGTFRATARTREFVYDLRWHDAEESLVPLWWIGVSRSESGDLLLTRTFDDDGHAAPDDLMRWLEPLVGKSLAGRLVSAVAKHRTTDGALIGPFNAGAQHQPSRRDYRSKGRTRPQKPNIARHKM